MGLLDLIGTVPLSPIEESETFHDNRTKLHLLYRDNAGRADVLITPFGEDLRGKKDLTTYIRFLPNKGSMSCIFQDAEISSRALRDGSFYFKISDETKKAVIPFATKEDFPYTIMQNSFAVDMANANENLLKLFVSSLEKTHQIYHKKNKSNEDMKGLLSSMSAILKGIELRYESLRGRVYEAIEGRSVDSRPIKWHERQFRDYLVKDIGSVCPRTRPMLCSSFAQVFVSDPLKHFVYSTEENRVFGIPSDEKRVKECKAFLDYIESESPLAREMFEEMLKSSEKSATRKYHNYLLLGTLGAMVSGNPIPAALLGGLWFSEKRVSEINALNTGYHTGIMGSIRDKFGLTRKYVSPFDLISEDYDFGQWRKRDLE